MHFLATTNKEGQENSLEEEFKTQMGEFKKMFDEYNNNALLILQTLRNKYGIEASAKLNKKGDGLSYPVNVTEVINYLKGQHQSPNS